MSVPSESWTLGPAGGVVTSAWNTAGTLAVTSAGTSIGSVLFSGQAYTGLNAPLPGWPEGIAS